MALLDKMLATQGVMVTPYTSGDESWDAPTDTAGTPFRAYVMKLTASQAYSEGRSTTNSQYTIYAKPGAVVEEKQTLDVPGEGRLRVISVVSRKLGSLAAVLIAAEKTV